MSEDDPSHLKMAFCPTSCIIPGEGAHELSREMLPRVVRIGILAKSGFKITLFTENITKSCFKALNVVRCEPPAVHLQSAVLLTASL